MGYPCHRPVRAKCPEHRGVCAFPSLGSPQHLEHGRCAVMLSPFGRKWILPEMKISAICQKLPGLEMTEQEPNPSLPASEARTLSCSVTWVAQLSGQGQAGCRLHALDLWGPVCSGTPPVSLRSLSSPSLSLSDSPSPH